MGSNAGANLEDMSATSGSAPAARLTVERFAGTLAPRSWRVRQAGRSMSRLLVLESRSGQAALRGTIARFNSPALFWQPGEIECEISVEAGAQGYLVSIPDDILTRTVASSGEALTLRRTIDRMLLVSGHEASAVMPSIQSSCATLLDETRSPGRGSATLIAAHVLMLSLHLWRSAPQDDAIIATAPRGDGPRLIGNFLQLVELHYRDSWPVKRYAAALGVTEDRLHAHCKRERGQGPRTIIHQRLTQEACARLLQRDLPVEQIAYGLGFRDPAYFNRFFRKYQGMAPGAYRRKMRLEQEQQRPTYAAWP